jgi:dipeptidyl-peptidase-4
MKKLLLTLCMGVLSLSSFAQQKQLSMEDAVLRQRSTLAPERIAQLQWIKKSNAYIVVKKENNQDVFQITDASHRNPDRSIHLAAINTALRNAKQDTLTRLPLIEWIEEHTMRFTTKNASIYYDWINNTATANIIPANAEHNDIHAASKAMAYVKDNNLFIIDANNDIQQITKDGSDDIVYGQAVHRNEYGINKGTFWNNDGSALAFYRMDQSMVTSYPIYQLDQKPATAKMIKYPMAGMKSHEVSIGVYNRATKQTVYLKIDGPKDQYLTNISWNNDNQTIYVVVLNRTTTHLDINAYNASTGDFIKTILSENNNVWLEPTHPLYMLSNSTQYAIWESANATGHHQYSLVDLKSGSILTSFGINGGDVLDIQAYVNDKIYYTWTNGLDIHFACTYLFVLKNGLAKIPSLTIDLTTTPGIHTPLVNETSGYWIDQWSNATTPRIINVMNAANKIDKELLNAGNPLKEYALGKTSLVQIKSADASTTLYARIILPTNFDSTKKYPSITYVYNGPHVQLVNNGWLNGADLWQHLMAERGYIVFVLDGRGSDHRGLAFEQAIHRHLGDAEIADQLQGNKYLRSLPYVDSTRMGIYGWSFGGFMTTSLMTRTPNAYKVGVCGGPVIDWNYYEVMYTERYMDSPAENPDGYQKASTLNYIDNLKGKLLMIHGTSDDVVVWQNSLMYIQKCVEKGKQIDYFVYPGHLHNVLGKDRVHLLNKISNYFETNL